MDAPRPCQPWKNEAGHIGRTLAPGSFWAQPASPLKLGRASQMNEPEVGQK